MPKITEEFKAAIKRLPVEDLQIAILKFARKDQTFYDFLNLQYINKNEAEEKLFEETISFTYLEIDMLGGRGAIQRRIKSAMDRCIKQINHYVKVSKNKKREADLLLFLLDLVTRQYSGELGTCLSTFDSKLALTTNRLYNLVTKKLHPDYFIEYEEKLNEFLQLLHKQSNHLDYVFDMPEVAEINTKKLL
jgi:hypothetical protein